MSLPRTTRPHHPFDSLEDVVCCFDAEGRFTFVNTFALETWKIEEHEALGKTLQAVVPSKATEEILSVFWQALRTQERAELETIGLRYDGWIGIVLHPDRGGLVMHVRRLLRNTPTVNSSERDPLTGYLNRQAFQDLQPALVLPQLLAIVDLNRLKSINAMHGHSGGDFHIRTLAQTITAALPPDSLACRWGGDEFVLLVPGRDQTALELALSHAQPSAPFRLPGLSAFSVGIAEWQAGTPFERGFAVADEQLQQHKELLNGGLPEDLDVRGFVEISQRLEALSDPDDIIQHALDNLLNLLDFDHAVYFEWEGDDMYVSHLTVRPGIPMPAPAIGVRLPIAGLVAKVQRLQQTAWSTDYTTETETMPMMVRQGVRSALLTPVFSQGRVVASLVLRTVHRWQTITPHMRKVVELTALRLEHALELRRAVAEVRSTLESGLLTLGIVLEARDLETHGHTERAAAMAVQLGVALGWQGANLDRLREGAYLHDLGKISIPDAILQKPGPLTPEEWTTMKTHVTLGWDLASRIRGLSPTVLEVIRHHHERWDGTGYPDGLAGTAIPLAARIFAVCDVYDALISERPYKNAWTPEAARREIQTQSGRHFDPDVVRALLTTIESTYMGPHTPP